MAGTKHCGALQCTVMLFHGGQVEPGMTQHHVADLVRRTQTAGHDFVHVTAGGRCSSSMNRIR